VAITITTNLVGSKREKLGVKYPNEYASDVRAEADPKAYQFNLHQRGAQNPLETYTTTLAGLLIGGEWGCCCCCCCCLLFVDALNMIYKLCLQDLHFLYTVLFLVDCGEWVPLGKLMVIVNY
jgi:hypothetical protein